MATKRAYKGSLECQTDGVSGSAGYDALTLLGSCSLSMSRDVFEVPRKGTEYKTHDVGQLDMEITGTSPWDPSDAILSAMEDAEHAGTHLGFKFLDEASTGNGVVADWLVTNFTFDHQEGQGQVVNFTLKPTYIDTLPAAV